MTDELRRGEGGAVQRCAGPYEGEGGTDPHPPGQLVAFFAPGRRQRSFRTGPFPRRSLKLVCRPMKPGLVTVMISFVPGRKVRSSFLKRSLFDPCDVLVPVVGQRLPPRQRTLIFEPAGARTRR